MSRRRSRPWGQRDPQRAVHDVHDGVSWTLV
jgi:hypothetical protein